MLWGRELIKWRIIRHTRPNFSSQSSRLPGVPRHQVPPPPPHYAFVCLQGKVVVFEKMKNERKEMTSSHGEDLCARM